MYRTGHVRFWFFTWVDEPLDPALAHGGQLVDADGEVVQRLGRVLAVEVTGTGGKIQWGAFWVVVDQKGLSAEFLPKVSAEIRQKVFLHLFGLSVLLQKHFLSAECQSFCRNCSFLQLESCFEGSMVLHLS